MAKSDEFIAFGAFRLFCARRILEKHGAPLNIGGRAFDILVALAQRPQEVVSKRELFACAWPNVTVDDSSLRFHIGTLRRILGDGGDGTRFVANVPGRGYYFAVPVSRSSIDDPQVDEDATVSNKLPLPALATRIFGREEALEKIRTLLTDRRFVSIVGTGGIGKTTLAVALGHDLSRSTYAEVYYVDLAAVDCAKLLPAAISTAMGLPLVAEESLEPILRFLAGRRSLVILDGCEHVVDAAASFSEALFLAEHTIAILATSREALRAKGECIYRLETLACPPEGPKPTARQVLAYPAAQLFAERLVASGFVNRITDNDAPTVGEICRRLDGIALALELAASQADIYGIQGIATLLDTQVALHLRGRRSAMPRQQTLGATLDCSYRLLSELERTVLRQLSIFVGGFCLEASHAVSGESTVVPPSTTAEVMATLAAKSLVAPYVFDGETRYRLLDTTRTYLRGILQAEGEGRQAARRHAEFIRRRLKQLDAVLRTETAGRREFVYAQYVADVRAALGWSFGAGGDAQIAVDLTFEAARLLVDLSLLRECRFWIDKALLHPHLMPPHVEMELQGFRGIATTLSEGNVPDALTALERALSLAVSLGDLSFQLRVLSGLQLYLDRIGAYNDALARAKQAEGVASRIEDPSSVASAAWTLATAHHLAGDQAAAYEGCLNASRLSGSAKRAMTVRYGFDSPARAMGTTARVLWLRGFPEQALHAADKAIDCGERLGHPVSLSVALMLSVGVYFWLEDFARAERATARILALSERHSLGPFNAFGTGLKGALVARGGGLTAGIEALRYSLAALEEGRQAVLAAAVKCALAETLAAAGQSEEACELIGECVARDEAGGHSWYSPELRRVQAMIIARSHKPSRSKVADMLRASINLAQQQSALGWELRSAYAFAKLPQNGPEPSGALEALEGVYARFTEGHQSSDLLKVGEFLDEVSRSGRENRKRLFSSGR